MTISKKWKKLWIMMGIILTFIGILQWLYGYYYNKELYKCEKDISICKVCETNYLYIKTSGLWVYYTYEVEGKTYKNRCNLGLEYEDNLKSILLNKTFPVIYCKLNPKISTSLIIPKTFQEYGLTFPDSLNWIKNYKKE